MDGVRLCVLSFRNEAVFEGSEDENKGCSNDDIRLVAWPIKNDRLQLTLDIGYVHLSKIKLSLEELNYRHVCLATQTLTLSYHADTG